MHKQLEREALSLGAISGTAVYNGISRKETSLNTFITSTK